MTNINIFSSKRNKILLIAFISLAVIAGYTLTSPGCTDPTHDHSDHEPTDSDKEQIYTCSMHPQIRSTNPDDKCPICGMDLIPVETDDDEDTEDFGNTLRLSPRAIALAGIRTAPAELSSISPSIPLSGRVEYDETGLRAVTARMPGRLDRLHVNHTGAVVRKGDILAEIYSPALLAAQEELLQAARQAEQSGPDYLRESLRRNFESSKEKLRLLGFSSRQIETIIARGKPTEHLSIESPLNGVVTELQVKQGVYVETGQPMYTLVDLSRVWVQFEAYESDLQHLNTGSNVSVRFEGIPGKSFNSKVTFIDPVLNPQTRTSKVRVELPNPGGHIRPGMFARGEISGRERTGITVPASAPLITGRRALVYVQLPGDTPRFEARDVTLGPRVNDSYIVTGNLSEGELVVVNGAFKIDSELQIRGRPSMMSPEGGAPPVHDHGNADHAVKDQTEHEKTSYHKPAELPPIDISRVLDYYTKAWQALASDDLEAWQTASESMQNEIDKTDWPGAYSTQRRGLLQGKGHIKHTDSLEKARILFQKHSNSLIQLVRTGIAENTWYIVHCPMAFDDKGADWLQTEEQVTNPYFAHRMLRCGEVTDTISGKGGN